MSSHDRLGGIARAARNVPGLSTARRMLVPRLRDNDMFRRLAHRLWMTDVATDGRGADLTAGNLLAGVGLRTLPVLLVDLTKVPVEALESVVEELATIQLSTAGFRPVLLLAGPEFAVARKYGYPPELVPELETEADQIAYWQRLRRTYGTSLRCTIPAEGLAQAQRVFLFSLSPDV